MSVRQMGLVWELDLSKPLKFLHRNRRHTMSDEVYVTTTDRERFAHERNLAHYARDVLARALSLNGIIAGTHAIEITNKNTLRLDLTAHEAHHLANTLEEDAGND